MKYTIKQLVRKPLQIQGRETAIITMLLVDEENKELKVKVWKSKWSDSFVIGMALIDPKMEDKPDRDGIGVEHWLINPDKGKGGAFTPRTFDSWFNAYQLAISFMAIMVPTKKMVFKDLDEFATKFKERLTNGPVAAQAKESAVVDLKESGLAPAEEKNPLDDMNPEEEISDEELEL